jgi:hypothetical protein
VYDVNLTAKNNLRWTPSEADIEFSADLRVQQTPDSLLVYGDLNALRGWYDFFNNRFTIQQADLSFDDVEGLDPVLTIVATTNLPSLAGPLDAGENTGGYKVTATITGRSKAPDISFTSDPATLDENQILQALTVGSLGKPGGASVAVRGSIDTYITRQLNRQLSGEMQKVFKGYVDQVEIDREGGLFAGNGDIYVSVNSPITSNLSVRYKEYLPGTSRTGTELTPSNTASTASSTSRAALPSGGRRRTARRRSRVVPSTTSQFARAGSTDQGRRASLREPCQPGVVRIMSGHPAGRPTTQPGEA